MWQYLNSKNILKFTAFVTIGLAVDQEVRFHIFNALALCGAVGSLFGVNSAHEHIQTYFEQQIDRNPISKGITE